ncbi:MAG: ABC transporter permease, partial [Chitinophagaceae bacterium]
MFRNYFKIALRKMGKHKGDTAINLVGLCVAFTCALLLFLSVFFEFSYDNFHKNESRIYHLYTNVSGKDGIRSATSTSVPMIPTLKATYPEVEYGCRYISKNGNIRYKDKQITQNLRLTDPDFFSMFSFPFVNGSAKSALNELSSLVLTSRSAKAIFGEEEAMGKTVQMQVGGEWKPFIVTGILENIPDNSSITFDMVGRFETDENYAANTAEWTNWNHSAYVQLKENVSPSDLVNKATPFYNQHFAEDIQNMKRDGIKPITGGAYM